MSPHQPASSANAQNLDIASYLGEGAAPANPEARKLEAYPYLDWLRFVLASVVLLGHESVPFPGPIGGPLAVAVFLALSGWLIGGILMDSDRRDLPRFFYNRSTRIWAPYVAAVALLYATAALREGISANWWKYLFYDSTFTHITWTVFPRASFEMPLQGTGNNFWSISVEEQFYLAAPLLMLFVRWGKHLVTWIVVALYLIATQSIFAPIAAGVCAAVLHKRHPLCTTTGARWLAAAGAAAMLACLWRWHMEPFTALFSIFTVLALTVPGQRTATGVFFGGISYPLYLNQWVGQFAVNLVAKHVAAMPFTILVMITYIVAVGVAMVAWWLIDRNVMLHRGRWYTPARGRACGIVAYILVGIGLVGGYILRLNGY